MLAGCASRAPVPVAPAAERIETASPGQAKVILTMLADQRRFDAGALALFLDGVPEDREELAVALGRIGDPRGRGMLQGLLLDGETRVRRAAAFALGEIGDREARPALIRATVDDDREVGALAVEALGKLGAPLADVRRPLGALVPAEGAARLAPFLFRFPEEAMPGVASELLASSDDPKVRMGAAYALAREARPDGAGALRALLVDGEAQIRAWAARGLGEVGGVEDLGPLRNGLADASASVRIQTLSAGRKILARSDALPPSDWVATLLGLLEDPLPGVRAAAIESSAAWLGDADLRAAVRAVFEGGSVRERELSLLAFARARGDDARVCLLEAASSPDRRLRARSAEAAGILGDLALVERLAADREPIVRVAALEARLAAQPEAIASVVREALADPDPSVRATALDALDAAPELTAEELARAFERSRGDSIDDARLAAVRAVAARAGANGGDRAAAVEWLEGRLAEADFLLRRETARALRELGGVVRETGPTALDREAPYYRMALEQASRPRSVALVTERGELRLRLDCPEAPLTCLSFLKLANQGFFDGLTFHRVVPDFVVQAGDPRGDGWGGPGYALRDEINRLRYRRGAVGMALSGPDTGGSQFFVTLAPQPHLDGGYTLFGEVVGGDAVLDRLEAGDKIHSAREIPEK